jgi:hypothetical protein
VLKTLSGRIRVYDEPVAAATSPGLGVKPSAQRLEPEVAPSRRAAGAVNLSLRGVSAAFYMFYAANPLCFSAPRRETLYKKLPTALQLQL